MEQVTFVIEAMLRRGGIDHHTTHGIDHLAIVRSVAARVMMAVIVARLMGVRRGTVGPFV